MVNCKNIIHSRKSFINILYCIYGHTIIKRRWPGSIIYNIYTDWRALATVRELCVIWLNEAYCTIHMHYSKWAVTYIKCFVITEIYLSSYVG